MIGPGGILLCWQMRLKCDKINFFIKCLVYLIDITIKCNPSMVHIYCMSSSRIIKAIIYVSLSYFLG